MAPSRLLLLCAISASSSAWHFTAAPATDLQPLFGVAAPFLGADVATSVPLPGTALAYLWLHGDTLTGTLVKGGSTRAVSRMPRNSVAILNVSSSGKPAGGVQHFISAPRGNPEHDGWWSPSNSSQWYWPTVGIEIVGETYVIAMRVEDADPGTLFPFTTADIDVLALGRPTSVNPHTWAAPLVTTLPNTNVSFALPCC